MDLYTETILDHYEHPHHAGRLATPDVSVQEDNLLCGDRIQLDCAFNGRGEVCDIAFAGMGCALSQASMSLLSDFVLGKSCDELRTLSVEGVQQLVGSLITPARVKCAMLGAVAIKHACELYGKKE